MSEVDIYRARAELVTKITLQARQMRKDGKSLDDFEEWLIVHQAGLANGTRSRTRPAAPTATGNLPIGEPNE